MLKKSLKGFTLIEILIALFIFAILSLMTASIVRTLLSEETHTQAHFKTYLLLQKGMLHLSTDLEHAVPRSITNGNGKKEPALFGTQNDITFTRNSLANPLGEMNRSTLERVHYFLKDDQLIRETWPHLDQTTESHSQQKIVLSSLDALQLDYLDNNNEFHSTWGEEKTEETLPKAIRVTLIFKNHETLSQLYLIQGPSHDSAHS